MKNTFVQPPLMFEWPGMKSWEKQNSCVIRRPSYLHDWKGSLNAIFIKSSLVQLVDPEPDPSCIPNSSYILKTSESYVINKFVTQSKPNSTF
jgi:hypothetical protein